MLFFIDETWQEIDGQEVAALGGVAIPQRGYNAFCREVFALKRDLLGAVELRDAELKGKKCFAKRAFRKRDEGHRSKLIEAGDALFDLLKRHHARTFVIWTVDPALVSLRSTETTFLSAAYVQLLFDFRAYMRREAKKALGSLNFDQRDFGSDEAAACALQNYLVRTRSVDWRRHFLTVPSFRSARSAQDYRPRTSSRTSGPISISPMFAQSSRLSMPGWHRYGTNGAMAASRETASAKCGQDKRPADLRPKRRL